MRWFQTREFGVALVFLALGSIAQYIVPQYGIPIALAVAAIGFYIIRNAGRRELVMRDVELGTKLSSARRQLEPKRYLRGSDWLELEDLADKVNILHGHEDRQGIRVDRLDGYTWSEISVLPCHECQIPRNRESS